MTEEFTQDQLETINRARVSIEMCGQFDWSTIDNAISEEWVDGMSEEDLIDHVFKRLGVRSDSDG